MSTKSAKACSSALGQTTTEWLNNAARAAARQQNAAAYVAWEASRPGDMSELDSASAAASLDGAEW